MAPPGILSIDEHLDAVRTTCKNISAPAFSPQSKESESPARGVVSTSIFHDHDYVVQYQKQPFCESSTDSNSYEEIDISSIDFDDFVSKTVTQQMGDATSVDDSNYGNKLTPPVARQRSVDNAKCHLIDGANDARLTENMDSSNIMPTSWFMDDIDGNFLDGLDEFDLELDEFDPCIDMDTEDPFQSFIEETLNNATTNTYMNDECELRDVTDEDTHKKEYFLKLLGLQSVSHHESQNSLTCSPEVSTMNTTNNTIDTQGRSPPVIKTSEVGACQRNNNNNYCLVASSSAAIIAAHPPSSPPASVPAKMCSCAATDWKNSLLYSTAPAFSNGLVQTNLSTAPTKSVAYNNNNNNNNKTSQNFCFSSNSVHLLHSSPSLNPPNNFEDMTPNALFGGDGSHQLKNQSDADAFLQWLEEDGETAPSSTQASTEIISSERNNKCATSYKSISAQAKFNDVTNRVPGSTNHPLSVVSHSIPDSDDMDSFIDLEAYAMERSPSSSSSFSSSIPSGKDTTTCHSNYHLGNHPGDHGGFDPEEILRCVESKHPASSELRFRLSLLDDYNNSCRNDRYLEKKDTSCQIGLSLSGEDVKHYSTFDDPLADFRSDSASSPLSPYSSSSVHSSYGQPKGAEDRLDLLELFSEENSFMLMEQSDSRYGFC